MRFTVVTILPELVEPALVAGVVGRAREAGTITVATVNPRDFTSDRHRSVDDTPYGGGPGMVMKAEPMLAAIAAACGVPAATADAGAPVTAMPAGAMPGAHRILLTPAGRTLTQARVRELAALPHLVLVCGRYEGIDERVIEHAIDEELSIGDYVLSGGELGALVVIDAVARLVPGVLGEPASADEESHSAGLLEYPQYTRPPKLVLPAAAEDASAVPDASPPGVVREVPPVLFTGNHAAIASWRRRRSIERTAQRRPDMFARFAPSKADRKLVAPLAARTHLALVHYPVHDRTGAVVTTSLTNFDIHDLARSSLTYGLAAYHIVTPITSQREKAEHIARLWLEDTPARPPPSSGSRANALALIRTADTVETVVAELTASYGRAPRIVATSARRESFPSAARCTPDELRAQATVAGLVEGDKPEPLLLLLGTGWGLADDRIQGVGHLLSPIEGASDWNHLSVRSAAAILLDRLFGRPP